MLTVVPARHSFSVNSLLLMEQAGVFASDQRIELLAGEVINMSPIHAPHATCVRNLLRVFQQHLPASDYIIDVRNPVQLLDDSLPQPDVAVGPYRAELLALGHWQAADVRLIVEVADSTYRYDRYDKYAAYAKASIPEYWIINLKNKRWEVFAEPNERGYASEQIYQDRFDTSFGFEIQVDQLLSFL